MKATELNRIFEIKSKIEEIDHYAENYVYGLEGSICDFDSVDEEVDLNTVRLEISEWASNRDSEAVEALLKFAENTLRTKGEKTGDGNGDATIISIYTFNV